MSKKDKEYFKNFYYTTAPHMGRDHFNLYPDPELTSFRVGWNMTGARICVTCFRTCDEELLLKTTLVQDGMLDCDTDLGYELGYRVWCSPLEVLRELDRVRQELTDRSV